MGKINSRQKGKRGELECVHLLKEHGYEARRGQQFKGGPDSPDVICEAFKGIFHVEVKRVERFDLYKALKQANEDKGKDEDSLIFHKKNGENWCVVLDAEAFLRILDKQMDI